MIEVRVGTTDALETREDAEGNQSVHKVSGERIIMFLMPDGVTSMDASTQVIGALNGTMMEVGATPWWIESNDQGVSANLLGHYGVTLDQMPPAWGDGTTTDTGGTPERTTQTVSSPPPDPQLPSAPTLPPESEPEAEPEPEPEPEVEVDDESAPEPEPQPEGDA